MRRVRVARGRWIGNAGKCRRQWMVAVALQRCSNAQCGIGVDAHTAVDALQVRLAGVHMVESESFIALEGRIQPLV